MLFITSNKGKIKQASLIFQREGLPIEFDSFDFTEPEDYSVEEIAKFKAKQAFNHFRKPLFVEDSILSINALNGYPGVISNRVLKENSLSFFLGKLKGFADRSAVMTSVIAYIDETLNEPIIFTDIEDGLIAHESRALPGLERTGFNPIFILKDTGKTIAEYTLEELPHNHRFKTFKQICEHIKQNTL